jgi:hypothetical protein
MPIVWAALLAAILQGAAAAPSEYLVAATSADKAALLAADEPAWKNAARIAWGPAPYETRFRALWSPNGLFVRFDADDVAPWHTMTRRDDHLWDEEVVEVFLDLDRSGRDYFELEISPANVICDVRMAKPWPDKYSDLDWNMDGLETRVVPTPGRAAGSDAWTAVGFLPWSGFRTLPSAKGAALPPAAGDRWRMNAFRIKRPGGPSAPGVKAIAAAWSAPGQPSFHVPTAFRDFVFQAPAAPRGTGR